MLCHSGPIRIKNHFPTITPNHSKNGEAVFLGWISTVNQRERFDPMMEKQVEVSLHEVTGDAQPWRVCLPAAVVIIKANGDLTPLGDGPQRVNV